MRHSLNILSITIIFMLMTFVVIRKASAIPVLYSFSGTEYVQVGDVWSSEAFTGLMSIDSVPIIVSQGSGFEGTMAYWSITNFTVCANNFNFVGSGKFYLLGNSNGLLDINEPNIAGYGVTPYFSGDMTNGDSGSSAHYFYHKDGTPYEVNIDAYLAELPFLITGDLWNFVLNTNNSVWLQYSNATRICDCVPVPEPSSFILLGCGLFYAIFLNRKSKPSICIGSSGKSKSLIDI